LELGEKVTGENCILVVRNFIVYALFTNIISVIKSRSFKWVGRISKHGWTDAYIKYLKG
jgi:hypothetical protein